MNIVEIIDDFLQQISRVYTKKSFGLYLRMLKKHKHKENIMLRHLELFKNFCFTNQNAIEQRDIRLLTNYKLLFSNLIYIDMNDIFNHLKDTNKQYFWEYLNKIRLSFQENNEEENQEGSSDDELIHQSIQPNQMIDPMMLFGNMMNSNIIPEIIESFQSNGVDLENLQESIQTVTSTILKGLENVKDPGLQAMLQMAKSMIPTEELNENQELEQPEEIQPAQTFVDNFENQNTNENKTQTENINENKN